MPPNLLLVMVDDLGWQDLGCYGSSFHETPALDRLATDGVRFTDAYAAAPVCSPTRASVMSGQYPARVGVTDWIDFWNRAHPAEGKVVDAPYVDHLPQSVTTLPSLLSDAGYRTWHVGKWHLGGDSDQSLPDDHGFDVTVGGSEVGMPEDGYFSPWDLPNLADGPAGEHLTDRLTDEAIDRIRAHDGSDPFFLNLWFYAVHTPIEAKRDTRDKYEHKRDALGLDEREEMRIDGRFPFDGKKAGRIRRRLVQADPTYAAMVDHLDDNVRRLLAALEEAGISDDTLVVFTSDHGGLATAEGSPTCNRPLQAGKGWLAEGGIRVPLIVRWPGVTDDQASGMIREPVTTPDLYPTLLDAAGVDSSPDQPLDGETLRPLFTGGGVDRDALFWHYPHHGNQGGTPAAAVRVGRWKLIEFFEDEHVELYDLASDVGERTDLSAYLPDRVSAMRTRLHEWFDEVGARLPAENPDFEPWDDRQDPGLENDAGSRR